MKNTDGGIGLFWSGDNFTVYCIFNDSEGLSTPAFSFFPSFISCHSSFKVTFYTSRLVL